MAEKNGATERDWLADLDEVMTQVRPYFDEARPIAQEFVDTDQFENMMVVTLGQIYEGNHELLQKRGAVMGQFGREFDQYGALCLMVGYGLARAREEEEADSAGGA